MKHTRNNFKVLSEKSKLLFFSSSRMENIVVFSVESKFLAKLVG